MIPLVDAVAGERVVCPAAFAADASLVAGPNVRAVTRLDELVTTLHEGTWPDLPAQPSRTVPKPTADLADVRGQAAVRKVIELAAAGAHHLLMVGPPGRARSCWPTARPASFLTSTAKRPWRRRASTPQPGGRSAGT